MTTQTILTNEWQFISDINCVIQGEGEKYYDVFFIKRSVAAPLFTDRGFKINCNEALSIELKNGKNLWARKSLRDIDTTISLYSDEE